MAATTRAIVDLAAAAADFDQNWAQRTKEMVCGREYLDPTTAAAILWLDLAFRLLGLNAWENLGK